MFPVAVYLLERPDRPEILWLDALVAAAIIWLHRANIRRLLNGTENRFGRRAAPPAASVTRIAVLGAGSWGTTLANLLARKGDDVRLWAYEPEVVEAVNRDRARTRCFSRACRCRADDPRASATRGRPSPAPR